MADPFVVVGAGQAGASAVARLRALGYAGDLVLVGSEPMAPYQRPPLSKKYVAGELAMDRLLVRPLAWYQEQRVDLRLGCAAIRLDSRARRIDLADGASMPYDRLLLTTGSRPRRLPAAVGGAFGHVLTIRGLADADALAPRLVAGRRLLVVGGGYIGLEGAAVAAAKGMAVTLIEALPRILQRVAAPATADYFRALHERHGVTVREGVSLESLVSDGGVVIGARLADGSYVDCDTVLVGIGIVPNDELARAAGLAVDAGILVDERCRTSDTHVFAAGDCASFPWRGARIRLESVQNAIDQAEHAAGAMLGSDAPYDPTPWFWSDQYDVKLQIAGLNRGYDGVVVRPGKRQGSQSVWYFQGDRLLAVDAMNDALAYAFGKKIIEAGKTLPRAVAADGAADLKPWA